MAGRLNVALEPNAGPPLHVVLPSITLRSRKDAVPDFPHQAGHHPEAQQAGLPVFWVDDLPLGPEKCWLVAGIGSTQPRGLIETMLVRGYHFTSVVHPSATISPRSAVGDGCVVNASVVISRGTTISSHVVLNRGCLIGHDVRVNSFCTVGPGANIAGGCDLGVGAYIGMGAVVRDHVTIGSEAVVGAGAVVVKSVAPNTMVAGGPARIIKTGVSGL